jgi:hypothetical protein
MTVVVVAGAGVIVVWSQVVFSGAFDALFDASYEAEKRQEYPLSRDDTCG